MDSRESPPMLTPFKQQFPHAPLITGGFEAKPCLAAKTIILSPGISMQQPLLQQAAQQGIEIIGDIELFARHCHKPVIAITGSNGKSTVTSLVADIAKAAGIHVAAGGNLGRPALDLLGEQAELYVLELSSFQLETTQQLAAAAAVILNLSADHLDRYADMNAYLKAKQRIYRQATTSVVNRDQTAIWQTLAHQKTIGFGQEKPAAGDFGLIRKNGETWLAYGEQCWLATDKLQLIGEQQWCNVLAAFALAKAYGLSKNAMLRAAQSFRGLPHRLQSLGEKNGVQWVNDSKATNVAAAIHAIESTAKSITGRILWIGGGQEKQGQDDAALRRVLQKHCRHGMLIGEVAQKWQQQLADTLAITIASDLTQAVALANQLAQPGDAVLLAPACASFDMFANFEQRGEQFMQAVAAL